MHWIGYALDRLDASKEKFNELEDKAIEKLITVRKGTRKKKKGNVRIPRETVNCWAIPSSLMLM